jgi:hypothetical protein
MITLSVYLFNGKIGDQVTILSIEEEKPPLPNQGMHASMRIHTRVCVYMYMYMCVCIYIYMVYLCTSCMHVPNTCMYAF